MASPHLKLERSMAYSVFRILSEMLYEIRTGENMIFSKLLFILK